MERSALKGIAWLGGFMIFIMIIAAWSRISQLKQPGQLIDGATSALANLFKGVFR